MKIKTEVMTITPEVALKMLTKNQGNRPLKPRVVTFYAQQMTAGKWMQTGEVSVIFADTGRLLDGQHTLSGIVKSGVTLDLLVTNGVKENAFNYIDTGSSRSSTDIIGANGFKHPAVISAACRVIMLIQKNLYNNDVKSANISNADVLNFVIENKQVVDSADFACSICSKNKLLNSSVVTTLHFLFSKTNVDKADEFFDKFSTGVNLAQGDPILALRDRLMQDINNKSKLTRKAKTALAIWAWNAFIKGKDLKSLKLTDTFPKIL